MERKSKERWKLTPFGVKVKKRLIEKDMTTSELANRIGVSRSFLSQILYGNKKGGKYIPMIQEVLDIKECKRKKAVGE